MDPLERAHWVVDALERTWDGRVLSRRDTGRSTVMCLGTEQGSLWIKCGYALPPGEEMVIARLATQWAQNLPKVLASWRGGFAMAPMGGRALDVEDGRAVWRDAATLVASGLLLRSTLGPGARGVARGAHRCLCGGGGVQRLGDRLDAAAQRASRSAPLPRRAGLRGAWKRDAHETASRVGLTAPGNGRAQQPVLDLMSANTGRPWKAPSRFRLRCWCSNGAPNGERAACWP